jgi:hypothetical protein
MRRLVYLSVLLLTLISASQGVAAERYYVLVFGSQRVPPDSDDSHTFAAFVRLKDTPVGPRLECYTISWLPANLVIRTGALLPEPGRNLDLCTTLNYVLARGERVSLWGPYETDRRVFTQALEQIAQLQSGQVQYKAIDSFYPSNRVCNCIHAVSQILDHKRIHIASPGWGETASYYVTLQLLPYISNPGERHVWLTRSLGLDRYPIIYRDLEPPRSGFFWSGLRRAAGEGWEEQWREPFQRRPGP